MSRTVFCVGGVSGSGKSYLIEMLKGDGCWVEGEDGEEEYLRADSWEPFVYDISSEYEDRNIGPEEALDRMLEVLEEVLEEGAEDEVILEAFFKPNSEQLTRVCELAADYDADVVHIWCSAPKQLCLDRIQDDYYQDGGRRNRSRQLLTSRSPKWCFHPIRTDGPIPTYNFINDEDS